MEKKLTSEELKNLVVKGLVALLDDNNLLYDVKDGYVEIIDFDTDEVELIINIDRK